jgi:hypothetical protein
MKLIVRLLEVLILLLVVVGFLVIFCIAVNLTWDYDPEGENFVLNETTLYVATALSGFMMAFFSNKMGIDLPETPTLSQGEENLVDRMENTKFGKWLAEHLIKNYIATKKMVGSIYLIVYFIVAVIAIVTWVYRPDITPPVLKNVASISVTMFISIAKGVLDTIE